MSHPATPAGADPRDDRVLKPLWDRPITHCHTQLALAAAWIQDLGARRLQSRAYVAPATWEVLRRAIRVWIRYLDTVAQTDVPTTATVVAFRTWSARTRTTASCRHLLEAVHQLYQWTADHDHAPNIADGVAYLAVAPTPRGPLLTDADFRTAVEAIAGDDVRAWRDRAILWTLWSCPIDTIALRRANIAAFNSAAGTLQVAGRWGISLARRHGGIATTSHVLLPAAVRALTTYLNHRPDAGPTAPLLINGRGQRLAILTMRLAVLRALTAAGVRTSCATRHSYLGRYPSIAAADLATLTARLPTDPVARARLRALAHLVAIPHAHIAWERLRLADVDLAHGAIRGRRNTGDRVITLDVATATALADWIALRDTTDPDAPVFPDADGQPPSHHELKRALWTLYPERLPPMSPTVLWGSSSVLRRSVQARERARA